jgi:hypothetical protein
MHVYVTSERPRVTCVAPVSTLLSQLPSLLLHSLLMPNNHFFMHKFPAVEIRVQCCKCYTNHWIFMRESLKSLQKIILKKMHPGWICKQVLFLIAGAGMKVLRCGGFLQAFCLLHAAICEREALPTHPGLCKLLTKRCSRSAPKATSSPQGLSATTPDVCSLFESFVHRLSSTYTAYKTRQMRFLRTELRVWPCLFCFAFVLSVN